MKMTGEDLYNQYPHHEIKIVGRKQNIEGFKSEDLIDEKWSVREYEVSKSDIPPNKTGSWNNWFTIDEFIEAVNSVNTSPKNKPIIDIVPNDATLQNRITTTYAIEQISGDTSVKQNIISLIGNQSNTDRPLIRQMRFHQSWWRTCILGENQGVHPKTASKVIGSSIRAGEQNGLNFLDQFAIKAVNDTLRERDNLGGRGMIETVRLFNNLLASQPLCFNFFGRLKYNLSLATKILSVFYPSIDHVTNIIFEYAPNAATNGDNSAHDIGIEYTDSNGKTGLIGLECKYTEPFSQTVFDKEVYQHIYSASQSFLVDYDQFMTTDFNQLFRNQLIAESALLNGRYDNVYTGLFYFRDDDNAQKIGNEFQSMLKDGTNRFRLITYSSFIQELQKIDLDWDTREWTMLLWARYIAVKLSKQLYR